MKKLLLITSLLALSNFPLAAQGESIKNFDVSITFDKSMKAKVIEDITVDLGPTGKSGFIRSIPEEHYKGEKSAKEFVGVAEKDTTNRYESDGEGNVNLIIGAPGVVEKGIHSYRIVYESESAATLDGDKAKFTWDATGKQVKIPIDKMSVLVSLPLGVGAEAVEASASKAGDAKAVKIEKTPAFIKYKTEFIYPGQNLIVDATFPRGAFKPKTAIDKSEAFFDTTVGRVIAIIGVLMLIALAFSAMLAKRDHMR